MSFSLTRSNNASFSHSSLSPPLHCRCLRSSLPIVHVEPYIITIHVSTISCWVLPFVTFGLHLYLPALGVAPFSAAFLCVFQFDELPNIVESTIVLSCMPSADRYFFSFSRVRQAHPVL